MKEASELEYLRYFWHAADFGPADADVRAVIDDEFMRKYNMKVPNNYRTEE